MMAANEPPVAAGEAQRPWWRRLLPLMVIACISGGIIVIGWHQQISFESFLRHHDELRRLIAAHEGAALAAYVALYIVVAALSLPVGAYLTVAGGLLFGAVAGAIAAVIGASIGATVIFCIARSAFGEHLARRVGPTAETIAQGFRADAFNYLLFLRLVPVFPFWLVNLVAALAGVPLATFVAATALGIIPATFAFAFVGAGLDSVIAAQQAAYQSCLAAARSDCRLEFHMKAALTPELLGALVALGVLALIPVVVKRLRARSTAHAREWTDNA